MVISDEEAKHFMIMDIVIGLCESKIQDDKRALWDDITERTAVTTSCIDFYG